MSYVTGYNMETATATARPETFKHTFSLTVDVAPHWIGYLTLSRSVFGYNYIGYWACGIVQDDELGWLIYEDDSGVPRSSNSTAVEALWRAGEPLPERWHRLDRAAALRAWEEGCKQWGIHWYERTDATKEDVVVQLALLGEVRYG